MKIILSRKGFDSTSGGYPSPIINNKVISLPIPDDKDDTRYSDLIFDRNITYYDLMTDLGIKGLAKDSKCHLDPDLSILTTNDRPSGWRPLLGQIGGSQSHLEAQGVTIGDLFLFFGWFRRAEVVNGRFKYTGPDFHMIFGFLYIGEIVKVANNHHIPDWLSYHPHIKRDDWKSNETNTLYIAPNINGGGVLEFNESLILTGNNRPKSQWYLPDFFKNVSISHHPNPWKDSYFQSAGRGQEFVIGNSIDVENWAKKIILNNKVNN